MLQSLLTQIEQQGGERGGGDRGAGRRSLQEWSERRSNGIGEVRETEGERAEVGSDCSQEQSSGELGESCHPMILSQINNPRCNHLALLRIRNAASELRQAHLDLADFLEEQALRQQQFISLLAQGLPAAVELVAERLAAENEALQEHIFDMEQRVVGLELEVERRLRERGRQAERAAAALAREESREAIAQLQAEVAALREKCSELEQRALPSTLHEEQLRREESLREELCRLESRKEAAYQREHELLAGEESLSRKISDLRRKEAELSEWEAELTRKSMAARTVREVAARSQLAEDELNCSGEASLRSFGRHREEGRTVPTSLEQLGIARKHTLNNEEEPQSPRDIQFARERRQGRQGERPIGESAYQAGGLGGRRFNPQLSHHGSREASPYRALQDLKTRGNAHQHVLPHREGREASKGSRASVSRSRQGREGREGEGGLGSKLQRLREEIKKQIESMK